MELENVLHMNGGNGEISFAQTAYCTRRVIALTKSMRDNAMVRLFSECEGFQTELMSTLCMADLGCASGPNTLTVISEMIVTSELLKGSKEMEYQVYLNDLHGNDFNSVFMSLPRFQKELKEKCGQGYNGQCYVAGLPSSFYGRISPCQSLHLVHSLYSLHWLSRVPKVKEVNKGSIYLSRRSPKSVVKAYKEQFQKDIALFLSSRSEELVKGGQMLLTFMGRETQYPNFIGIGNQNASVWAIFDIVLNQMACERIIEEEKLESFNIPVYHPSSMEVKEEVEKQLSFHINEVQVTQVSFDAQDEDGANDTIKKGELPARLMRSVVESLFTSHFEGSAIDEIFRRYSEVVEDVLSKHKILLTNVAISITKK